MNKKYLAVVGIFLAGCATSNPIEAQTGHLIEANGFTVYAPAGWEFTPQIGIDSVVGELSGDGMTLRFDYGNNVGLFSQNSEFDASDYDVSQESINGVDATLYVPKVAGEGSTVLDMKNPPLAETYNSFGGDVTFNMFGENLTEDQEEVALQIFHTVEFKR